MLIIIAKVAALVFASLVISKSVLSYIQRKESIVIVLFWIISWGVIILLAFQPNLVLMFMDKSKAGIGTIIGIGLMFIYFVVYRVYGKVDRVEKDLQKLVRDIALKEVEDK